MLKKILSKDSRELIVMSVGGSIVVPNQIDTKYIQNLVKVLENHSDKYKYIIIVGGGKTARNYMTAAKKIKKDISNEDLDWIGIYSTRVNAALVKGCIASAHPKIIFNPQEISKFKEDFLIGGGFEPGVSSDYCAVNFAKRFNANKVINLTNVDHVYDKNPKEFKTAKPFKNLTWDSFFKIVGYEFTPGGNYPFDPKAGMLAKDNNKTVIIANGLDLDNLELILKNNNTSKKGIKKYKGTEIKN